MSIMTQRSRFWVVSICTKGSKMWIFSNFGGLAGDFKKDTYETKLCRIHIGSVSSGLDAENVSTGSKMPIVGVGYCRCFVFGYLGGDFCKETH